MSGLNNEQEILDKEIELLRKNKFSTLLMYLRQVSLNEKPLSDNEWINMINNIKKSTYDSSIKNCTLNQIAFDSALSTLYYLAEIDKNRAIKTGIIQSTAIKETNTYEPFDESQINWLENLLDHMFHMIKNTDKFPLDEKILDTKIDKLEQFKQLSGKHEYVCDLCDAIKKYFKENQCIAIEKQRSLNEQHNGRDKPIQEAQKRIVAAR